ncbi:MAG: ribosomal RNA small subunit methyltransferase A [Mycoplasma sp.]|nr:ribosomal RNA small subunit methyltransferase A [Mycoplasma sp.]
MNKFYAKRKFSQNFLNDKNILSKIANVINVENKCIIEIGPGKGSLTKTILENNVKRLVAFEIDNDLFKYLETTIIDNRLELINQDFLKSDLSEYVNFNIVANIPYNISTDIIFKIFDNYENFENVVLLVQKEFAQRICAKVNTKEYSKLSPSTRLFYDASYCFDVEANSFWPKPKVTSAVVHLKRTNNKYDVNYSEFLDFIKQSFSMRRKTFWNNIKNTTYDYEKFKNVCDQLNLKTDIRPEQLNFDQLMFFYKNQMKF